MDKEESFKNIIKSNNHYFCVSHFNGDIDWICDKNKTEYIVYNKSGRKLSKKINHINIKNVGYNLYSYLKFIIDNYYNLPNTIVFCKDNIFTRHLSIELFLKLINRKIFTCLEDDSLIGDFPTNLKLSDNGFVEINNSWYKFNFPRKSKKMV